MNKIILSIYLIVVVLFTNIRGGTNMENNSIPVSAPITTESYGKNGIIASQSVMRIINTKKNTGGTGFLHKSGVIITAAHVAKSADPKEYILILSSGNKINIEKIIKDDTLDLAILIPKEKIEFTSLEISDKSDIIVGSHITTWGFPSGYNSFTPLLTVGYLSGIDRIETDYGLSPFRWVVNAAFNRGNSGGPVLDVETGKIIGVVSSKLAPIPLYIESALEALSSQKSGFMYIRTTSDGKKENISEGRVIGEVLSYLRTQTQLVLGHAVTSLDLIDFLKKNNIDP